MCTSVFNKNGSTVQSVKEEEVCAQDQIPLHSFLQHIDGRRFNFLPVRADLRNQGKNSQ
jgi:hypothetical protein